MRDLNDIDEYEECCEGTGHEDGCESREPAYDIGDLICRTACIGCCSKGHKPAGMQAEQDRTAMKAKAMLSRPSRR